MEVISRKQAIEANLMFYFTGKPCKKGQHIDKRYTNNGHCFSCSKNRKGYHKLWYNENKDRVLLEDKLYYKENKEKIISRNKKYLKTWKQENKEHLKEYGKQKRKRRRKEIYANNAKRRAQRLQAVPKWADLESIKQIYKDCPIGHHVDHVIPLLNKLVCGLHVPNNLQYLKAEDNLKKSNKFTPVSY